MKNIKNRKKAFSILSVVIIVAILGVGGYFIFSSGDRYEEGVDNVEMVKDLDGAMMDDNTDGAMVEKDAEKMMQSEGDKMMQVKSGYEGNVLAGKNTPYIEYNKADYDKALAKGKIILLYFYASWCPICKAEQREIHEAFNSLDNDKIVAFRVNYKDNDTDAFETALAKEFGVAYQHTKVIIKNGVKVGKFPDTWDKDRYLSEIAKVAK